MKLNPEGKGVRYFANGDRYDGLWSNWQFHGEGKYTWANGDVLVTVL